MKSQSKPAKEHWTDLAKQPGEIGREDCQAGWQRLAASLIPTKMTVLDVGSGLGRIRERFPHYLITQDPAPGLQVNFNYEISQISNESYDVVTCFDVIEHVIDDITFLNHLKRIARRYVFITTPNLNISKAANGCHCREYSPQEFLELTKGVGRRLWVGDGEGNNHFEYNENQFTKHTHKHQAVMLDVTRGNLGRWGQWYKARYKGLKEPEPFAYGETPTYGLGADWLDNCKTVEDWGCGLGGLKPHIGADQQYKGIDGTHSYFCDVVADLVDYHSSPEGIYIRGVLEHDRRWRQILDNAIKSFTKRMCLVLFTPLVPTTKEIAFNEELGVPDIAFNPLEITRKIDDAGILRKSDYVKSDTAYGGETIFYLEK